MKADHKLSVKKLSNFVFEMTEDFKSCNDCKWHIRGNMAEFRCTNPKICKPNYERGGVISLPAEPVRSMHGYDGPCGKEGKYWEGGESSGSLDYEYDNGFDPFPLIAVSAIVFAIFVGWSFGYRYGLEYRVTRTYMENTR